MKTTFRVYFNGNQKLLEIGGVSKEDCISHLHGYMFFELGVYDYEFEEVL